jgi:hypothetical protein
MIEMYDNIFRRNAEQHELIEQFRKEYQRGEAIHWYLKHSLVLN